MDYRTRNSTELTVSNLSQAIFTVNRHAKTATNPSFLYDLKKTAINKMIREKKATKIGLHFSRNPKFSQQRSDVLIECGDYLFHIPPTKEDFKELPHLGQLDSNFRNPKTYMSLSIAKKILQRYTGIKEDNKPQTRTPNKPVFKKLGESFYN
ncbi:YkyB family protein [Lederbergia graminis]|uniref:YkyB family protein n=1 Tax=Lederbergia graminis TaxID=735518 RepID=A0ABW0LH86_9BACI|nr:YkyB family protein [Paenibacillus bovis]HLU21842.1 YkyB family protein [Bacillaceae bacterium]